jgi:hypothetical protein
MNGGQENGMSDRILNWLSSAGNVVVMLVLLAALGWLAFGIFTSQQEGEVQIGMVVVFAIAALLVLLTVMAAIFSSLKLADPQEALGLPNGSVRALIALFLVMIFITMSVYLFRITAGRAGVALTNLTASELAQLGGQVYDVTQNDSGTFDVVLRVGITPAAEQLALQLVTILGTLVTAVSAFYFGSSTASSALKALPTVATLRVDSITPPSIEAAAGTTDTTLTVSGAGFIPGAQVKLRLKGQPDIVATKATVENPSKIVCSFNLQDSQRGKWDVLVINPDGSQVSREELFEIK